MERKPTSEVRSASPSAEEKRRDALVVNALVLTDVLEARVYAV